MKLTSALVCCLLLLSACASPRPQQTLYTQLGGLGMIENIADAFINEIGKSDHLYPFFENSSVDRFREKFIEHICMVSNGPCEYTGDSMQNVHANMGINEAIFNHTVEVLINAMSTVGVSHRLQNQILKRLAPMREDIIYVVR
jgi:hemoglobin